MKLNNWPKRFTNTGGQYVEWIGFSSRQRIVTKCKLNFWSINVCLLYFMVFRAEATSTTTEANYPAISADVVWLARKLPRKDETVTVFTSYRCKHNSVFHFNLPWSYIGNHVKGQYNYSMLPTQRWTFIGTNVVSFNKSPRNKVKFDQNTKINKLKKKHMEKYVNSGHFIQPTACDSSSPNSNKHICQYTIVSLV